jgi:23S rRNA (adenine2503-C2)-methyltransferase
MTLANLCGLTVDEIYGLISGVGSTRDHAISIANSIYKKKINNISLLPKLPKRLKYELGAKATPGFYSPFDILKSSDGTIKCVFINDDGLKFETVFIPEKRRRTVCVSVQSGCRMGCSYCATGRYGFFGNLSASDILNQILSIPVMDSITHVVFMGMGEPLDNLENVMKACKIITSGWGMALSPRNVTVSTIGITGGLKRFLKGSDCNLTLSLHSPFTKQRLSMIPSEKHNPARSLIAIMKAFPRPKTRRMSIAYLMIDGFNDTPEHLNELKRLLEGSGIRINLLHYHTLGCNERISSSTEKIEHFKHEFITSGISASVRRSRGLDISAACGLLAAGKSV